jgi:hypothetical protein
MKGRIFLLVVLLVAVAAIFGCSGTTNPSTPTPDGVRNVEWYPSATVFPILAGKNLNIGTVAVSNNLSFIHVAYQITAPNWFMNESQVAIATTLGGIPQSKGGPIPGQFPYKTIHNPVVTSFSYDIPLNTWTAGTELYVATHCSLQKIVGGIVTERQTGWSGDHEFPGKNWAMYFHYTVAGCHINLPTDTVCVTMHYPGTQSYWSHDLSSVPAGYDVADGNYLGWCLQANVYAYPDTLYCGTTLYAVTDPNLPAVFANVKWDMINWVLNHKNGASNNDIQDAIWYFSGSKSYPTSQGAIGLIMDAEANGVGYVPGPGEIMSVVVYIANTIQSTFIEVEVGC